MTHRAAEKTRSAGNRELAYGKIQTDAPGPDLRFYHADGIQRRCLLYGNDNQFRFGWARTLRSLSFMVGVYAVHRRIRDPHWISRGQVWQKAKLASCCGTDIRIHRITLHRDFTGDSIRFCTDLCHRVYAAIRRKNGLVHRNCAPGFLGYRN